MDLAKITTASQNEYNADAGTGDEDDGDEDTAESEEEAAFTATASWAATSTSTPVPTITAARAVTVAASSATATTAAVTVDTCAAPKPGSAAPAHRASSQAPSDPILAATLTAILQEVKQLRPLADHPTGRSASLLTARRIQRLRETASLYDRLAELHREEARELVALEGMGVDEYN